LPASTKSLYPVIGDPPSSSLLLIKIEIFVDVEFLYVGLGGGAGTFAAKIYAIGE